MDQSSLLLTAKKLIIKHEDLKQFPYTDTTGHITIGVGYNLTTRGLPLPVILNLCEEDIEFCITELNKLPWFQTLNEARQIVLIDMCYNIGFKNLLEFHSMINAIVAKDYHKAADAMLNSLWAHQVKGRAIEDAEIMRSGIIHNA